MKDAARIVTWYVLLIAPMIAVLFVDGNVLSGTMAIVATVAISFATCRDIAKKSRENTRLACQVREVERIKKDFISRVSHELKTPLASMLETAQLMIERLPGSLTPKQERLLQLNLHCGRRLAGMIGNLLDLCRLEAGVVEYTMDLHDIGDICQRVVDDVAPQASEKSIRIVLNIARDPLIVHCDGNRMAQIITNLVDNAMHFSPTGSVIRVNASLSGVEHVLIAISDAGAGIDDAYKKAIFESFYPALQEKKSSGQSLGLGLPICRLLVEAHKGTIWVEDNPSGGSVFFVRIPMVKANAVALPKAV